MSLTFSSSQVYRPVVVLPIALALLAAAAAILWLNLAHGTDAQTVLTRPPPAKSLSGISMLVAHAEIPRGQLLSAGDFTVKTVMPAEVPAGALSQGTDAQGHMALKAIGQGAPILKDALSDQAVQGLSARVPQSYRAYAVAVSEANIAGGFVEAGDKVDLYVTLPSALFTETADHSDRSKATLLLQSVGVLAVGAKLKSDGTPQPFVRTVTLAVPTTDLAKLALATRLGSISFAIRNPADDGAAPVSEAELASLVGTPAAAAARSVAPVSGTTGRTRRGVPLYAGRNQTLLPVP